MAQNVVSYLQRVLLFLGRYFFFLMLSFPNLKFTVRFSNVIGNS